MSNFKEQLKKFLDDNSSIEKFKDVRIKDMTYLIEVFRYVTKDPKWTSDVGSESSLLVVDPVGGGIKKASEMYTDYTHVAKILKIGEGLEKPKYKIGDCVLLNPFDVTGRATNPDYALYKQFEHSFGMNPIMPDDMREHVPAIQARYIEYQFVLPEEYNLGTQNIVTFSIPEFKIKGVYVGV